MMDLHDAPGKHELAPYPIPYAWLREGDRIRDHGRIRTVEHVDHPETPAGLTVVHFTDGGDTLGIQPDPTDPDPRISIWR
jgi:hypothetical protein